MFRFKLETVKTYFDIRAQQGRRLLPDKNTAGGLEGYIEYQKAASLMKEENVKNVLDIGCNRGSVEFLFHADYPQKAEKTFIEGIDISEYAIKLANDLNLPNCNFNVCDGTKLPYPSESFDLVILVAVIEHVVDKMALLLEIHRVLRPSGKLFLTTNNPQCLSLKANLVMWSIVKTLLRKQKYEVDDFISNKNLIAILTDAGFESESDRLYFWPHLYIYFWHWSLIPLLPPKLLYLYQKACVKLLAQKQLPEWLDKRCKCTLRGILTKK